MRFSLLLVLAACQTPRPANPSTALPRLEAERLRALGRGDARTLEALLAPDLVITLGTLERTRPQILERMRAQAAEKIVLDETLGSITVRDYGAIAVTRGCALVRDKDANITSASFTNLWRWSGGSWQLVVGHVGDATRDACR